MARWLKEVGSTLIIATIIVAACWLAVVAYTDGESHFIGVNAQIIGFWIGAFILGGAFYGLGRRLGR